MSGMLSPFVYNQSTSNDGASTGYTIREVTDYEDDTEDSDLDDLELQSKPLLSTSNRSRSKKLSSPADNETLRRELFGELAEEEVGVVYNIVQKHCCEIITTSCCVSIRSAYRSITTVRAPEEQCLDGVRALAALWVLSFHVGRSFQDIIPPAKWEKVGWLYQDLDWHVALNGDMGVDVFLVLSGYLTCQSWIKLSIKNNLNLNLNLNLNSNDNDIPNHSVSYFCSFCRIYFQFVLQRFLRLAPLLYILVAMSSLFEPVLSHHPTENPCDVWWPVQLFLAANLYIDTNDCADHAWFVSMLFQLSLVTPFVLVLCHVVQTKCGNGWRAKSIVPVLVISLCTAIRGAAIREEFEAPNIVSQFSETQFQRHTFANPLHSGGPYFCGLLVFMWNYDKIKVKSGASPRNSFDSAKRSRALSRVALSRCRNVCMMMVLQVVMLISLVMMCIMGVGTHRTFGLRQRKATQSNKSAAATPADLWLHSMHIIYGRLLFGIIISFWVMVLTNGQSICGVSTFLGWSGWAPIARLSYASYLFTFVAIWIVVPYFVIQESLDPDGWQVRAIFVASFASVFVLLYCIAFIMYCIVEMPARNSCRRCRSTCSS